MSKDLDFLGLLEQRTREQIYKDAMNSRKIMPLRCSSGGQCPRKLSLLMNEYFGNAPRDYKPYGSDTYRLLNLGHDVENHVIRQLELLAPEYEIKFQQQHLFVGRIYSKLDPRSFQDIKGSCDFVLWHKDPGKRVLVDSKSKRDSGYGAKTVWASTNEKFKKMKSVKTISDQEYVIEDLAAFITEMACPFTANNMEQCNLYLTTEFMKAQGIEWGCVLYSNKNTSQLRSLKFRASEEVKNKTLESFVTAMDGALRKDPMSVPRGYETGSVACRYCPYEKTACDPVVACETVPETGTEMKANGI